jgi:hypothetical protein
MTEDLQMSKRWFTPVATTRKRALATSTSILKGCGSLTILLLFLLAVVTNANATATATTTTLKAGLTSAPATAITTAAYGASVTLTATVSPSTAAGTVNFTIGTTPTTITGCGAVAVSSGTATCLAGALPLGANSLKVAFTPTTPASYAASTSAAATVTVSQATTTTTLAVGLTSAPATAITTAAYGASVTLTATVSPAVAAGTVQFKIGTAALGSPVAVSSGTASVSTTALALGSNSLTAVFTPTTSADDTASTSAAKTVTVSQATTTTSMIAALTSAPSVAVTSAPSGASVTLTATVSPAAAAGTVQFKLGGVALGSPVAVSSGIASMATSALPIGANSLTAVFTPTTAANDTASTSNTVSLSVAKAATTTALVISAGPHYYGSSLTVTANVTPSTATGSVTFYDNGTSLGNPVSLASGSATISLSALAVGAHVFTATYGGDTGDATSSASSASTPVASTTTHVSVAASVSTTLPGSSFSLTATVTPAVGSATISAGSVSFYDSSVLLGTVAVSAGTATFTVPTTLAVGKHYLIASYGGVYNGTGTAQFASSLSSSALVTISTSQTITFTAPSTATYGNSPVSLSASSTSLLPVTFTASGVCSVSGSSLSFTGAGICTVTASQAGGSGYTAATPVPQTVTVSKASLTITASSPASITYGTAVPAVTAGFSAFVGADTKWTALSTQPHCTTAYTTTSPLGSYATSCSGAVSANYSITYVPGSVSVTIAPQTIGHWYAMSTVYGTPVTLSATSTSGLAVSYSIVSGPGSINGTTLTPSGVGTITVSASQAGNSNYSAATPVSRTVTVYQAQLVVSASSPSVTFGAAVPTITASYATLVNGDTSASLTSQPVCRTAYTASSHPGSYNAYCYGAVDANYSITYAAGSVTVTKAIPTISAPPTAASITYGAALSTSTLTGGSASVAGVFAWTTGATVPHVGGPAQSVTFTPTNTTDYTTAPTTVSLTVNKATPTISVSPTASSVPYGSLLSASKLSGGTASTPGVFSWTIPATTLNTMGANSKSITLTPADSVDYNTATGMASVTVTKATPIVTWPTASPITYGAALSTSTFIGGSGAGTFTWTSPTLIPGAGTPSESVTFTPTDTTDYSTATHAVSVTVNKAAPVVSSWPTASAINYGQALSSSKLTGGSTAGSFAWTSPSTVPNAGTPLESVTFTPTNSTNYTTATHTVSVLVNQVTPTVSAWPTASSILAGQTLANSSLTGGSASTGGSFIWTDNTVVPGVGTSSYSVTFTPSDATDYSTVNGWTNITVNACGLQDSTKSAFNTGLNVYFDSESAISPILDAEGVNESAICAVNSGTSDNWVVAVSYPTIISNAASTYPADSNSNGTDAAVLAYGTVAAAGTGATITITDDGAGDPGSINTVNDYSNGVFASMGGTVNITDTVINTSGNFAHALDATNAGTLNINDVVATTTGDNSAVIAAGVGGGFVTVNGGTYTATSSSLRSSGIRVAGTGSTVTVTDGDAGGTSITALNGSAVVIEGGNTVTINSNGSTSISAAAGQQNNGIYLYQGTLGEATAGTSTFTMTNGSISYTCDATQTPSCAGTGTLKDQNIPATLFAVTNTTAVINLTDVTVINNTPYNPQSGPEDINGTLLTAAALSQGAGGNVTFNAAGETLTGDIIVDSISAVSLNLAADSASNPSILTGAINSANSGAATVSLTLDATSSWAVADGPSYLTSLNNNGSNNIACQNPGACSVYVAGKLLAGVN